MGDPFANLSVKVIGNFLSEKSRNASSKYHNSGNRNTDITLFQFKFILVNTIRMPLWYTCNSLNSTTIQNQHLQYLPNVARVNTRGAFTTNLYTIVSHAYKNGEIPITATCNGNINVLSLQIVYNSNKLCESSLSAL